MKGLGSSMEWEVGRMSELEDGEECWEMLSSAHAVAISFMNSWHKIKGLNSGTDTVDDLPVPPTTGESWQISYRTGCWTWTLSIVLTSLHWSMSFDPLNVPFTAYTVRRLDKISDVNLIEHWCMGTSLKLQMLELARWLSSEQP